MLSLQQDAGESGWQYNYGVKERNFKVASCESQQAAGGCVACHFIFAQKNKLKIIAAKS